MEDTTGTALAIPQGSALEAVFRTKDGVDPIIDRIQREVRAHAPDLTTKKGRDAIASLAHKVSKSKVALDDAGKALTEDAKKQIAAVDAARKKVRDTLDALRDECRKPLTDWEAAEERRIAACKAAIHGFIHHGMTGEETSAEIRAKAEAMKAVPVGPDFGEFEDQANGARDATLVALRSLYQLAKLREDQAAELEALRAEKAEREAKEAEERAEAEAEALAKAAADEAERQRVAAEKVAADLAARIEADKLAAADKAKADAEAAAEKALADAKAEAERLATEVSARHAREIAEAKEREEAAAQRERDRIAAEQKAADDARAKREADAAHRAKIASDIAAALRSMAGRATPEAIAEALISGLIPHTTVRM